MGSAAFWGRKRSKTLACSCLVLWAFSQEESSAGLCVDFSLGSRDRRRGGHCSWWLWNCSSDIGGGERVFIFASLSFD